ncbi:hypothetical protein SARC_04919 [Sphaeroforma arctica JP610]|uniref:Uncharacterized protein n=1 Tax=Sphaeroforma arctica JP610 TaxID=667725 RepID=A0A0L0G1V0_9EUKA|nr:hypothetical protein SARC_04919 [Sphaeroforma arctica JP610]KNC82814.1 hypothetical protein SARC_04919 [Sphaeroforma arctica JP610]|eukprot:XP_014156716.1 hypothetical protein SARC_04919 [Sphaeroforma arctica JP610]
METTIPCYNRVIISNRLTAAATTDTSVTNGMAYKPRATTLRMLGANTDIAPHAAWIKSTIEGGKKTCGSHCTGGSDSVLCDTNEFTKCDSICQCALSVPSQIPRPSASPARTPLPTPTHTKAPVRKPVITPVAHTPVELKPVVVEPVQTAGCDHPTGGRQATIQWTAAWRYLNDCDLLEHFKDTVMGAAPSAACLREGFMAKVEELYNAQRSECGTKRRSVLSGGDEFVLTCTQKWTKAGRSSDGCGRFQAERL